MKSNKNLNVKVSVLILSVYCFMGSVEILKAPGIDATGGKESGKSGEKKGQTGSEHTGTHAGEPPVNVKAGSKPTESGSSHETTSKSGSGSKGSGKEVFEIDEEVAPQVVDTSVSTGKLSTADLTTMLKDSASRAKTDADIENIVMEINKNFSDAEGSTNISEEDMQTAIEDAKRDWIDPFDYGSFEHWVEAVSRVFTKTTTQITIENISKIDEQLNKPAQLFPM